MILETDKIIAKKENGIGWLIINNPEKRNAMSLSMREAMAVVFDEYNSDPEVRVLILKGNGGKAFISGADISEFKNNRNNHDAEKIYAEASAKATVAMQNFRKPIIAMIEGFCVGGGVATAISADIRLASEDSQFAIPAAKLGLAYNYENLKCLNDLVGPAYAKQILFTGDKLDASKALEIGLVNKVVKNKDLEDATIELAQKISQNAPLTIMTAKETISQISKEDAERNFIKLDTMVKECFDSEDYKEGREAFMQKRKPIFKGC